MFQVSICNYDWKVELVDSNDIDGDVGKTDVDNFSIKIAKEFPLTTKRITFIHEVSHAILASQGRHFQKKFDVEDLCEFCAYNHCEICHALSVFDRFVKE